MNSRFPFAIAWIAALIGIPAFLYDVFVGAAGALGSLNGSGHGGSAPLSTAAVLAYVCGVVLVVSTVLAIVRARRSRPR